MDFFSGMTLYAVIVGVATVLVTVLQLVKHWIAAKGKFMTMFYMNIVIFVTYFIMNTAMALHDPAQRTILFMNLVCIWAIFMAIKGIMRLKEKEKGKQKYRDRLVKKEKAAVFLGANRRYLTKRSAYKSWARDMIDKKYPCECDYSVGYWCDSVKHDENRYSILVDRLATFLHYVDKKQGIEK